jgi:hypothetical protein
VSAGVAPGRGLVRGASLARGRALVLLDARTEPPLPALSFALERLEAGWDVVALAGRSLVLRRTRTWHAFEALAHQRDPALLERRFVRRARGLGLRVHEAGNQRTSSTWTRLRQRLLAGIG